MKIYFVFATEPELEICMDYCKNNLTIIKSDTLGNKGYDYNLDHQLYFACTGIGVMHATKIITEICITQQADLIIQAGIAGSYNKQLAIGNVYTVSADRLADLGAQDHDNFLDVYELGLAKNTTTTYSNGWLFNTEVPYPLFFTGLMPLNSITVNTTTGNNKTVALWQQKYKPALETMEGAALHYVCLQYKVAFLQLRAISNYVEVRNKNNWNIPLALTNLNMLLIEFLETLK